MRSQELLPIALVAVVAVAALAMDDVPERLEPRAVVSSAKWFPVSDSLTPDETVVAAPHTSPVHEAVAPQPALAPSKPAEAKRVVAARETEPPRSRIQVEARRLPGTDRRVQLAAMKALRGMSDITGRIRVEAKNSVVRLSGWTLTSGQSLRAEKAALRVSGVKGVVNQIRPRLGPVTS
ncbi:MAG TPA: BON domain-containing protein [Usitatibacter sp.]|nr:BON domain-containing protein [Usitatibacter sp.]